MSARLYCFGESGNSYKAALTMELAGYDWAPVWVDFFSGALRQPDFQTLNPMGEAPVLVEGDLTLTQSCVIQLHVAERSGRFLTGERAEILRWLFWDAQKGSGQQGALRFAMNFLPPERRAPEVIAYLTGRVQAALDTLERHLDGRDWIVGDAPTIADFAAAGYLFYPEPFGFDRSARASIDRWLGNISALPGWKHPYDLMPGSPADRAPI